VTTSSPRGRRDNGLEAAAYVAAADLDPRVGEHLLDVLALAGIAAYLQPTADLHPISRSTTLPSRPTDRLWVDRARLDEAHAIVVKVERDQEQAAGPSEVEDFDVLDGPTTTTARRRRRGDLDIDAAWDAIVASWESDGLDDEPPPPLPVQGSLFDRIEGLDYAFDPHKIVRDDDEEGFVPPAPPPLPRASRHTVLALVLVVAGVVLFFNPGIIPVDPTFTLLLGIVALLSGFGIFIWRLRDDPPDDTDSDDGAVV
jgi:hypothetical protein